MLCNPIISYKVQLLAVYLLYVYPLSTNLEVDSIL